MSGTSELHFQLIGRLYPKALHTNDYQALNAILLYSLKASCYGCWTFMSPLYPHPSPPLLAAQAVDEVKEDLTPVAFPPQMSTWAMEQRVGSGVGTTPEGLGRTPQWVGLRVGGDTPSHSVERRQGRQLEESGQGPQWEVEHTTKCECVCVCVCVCVSACMRHACVYVCECALMYVLFALCLRVLIYNHLRSCSVCDAAQQYILWLC